MSGFQKLFHKSECLGTRFLSIFDVKWRFAQTVFGILAILGSTQELIPQIWPAGGSFSFVPANRSWSGPLQNLGSGAPMFTICKTFSQMRVSRDQNLINFCFKMSICANSLWNSCNSGINIEAHSLGSQQLADHFPMRLPIEADLDPFKTQVLEHLCPGIVQHYHKSTLRDYSSE